MPRRKRQRNDCRPAHALFTLFPGPGDGMTFIGEKVSEKKLRRNNMR